MAETGPAQTPTVRPINWWPIAVAVLTWGWVLAMACLTLRLLDGELDRWAAAYGDHYGSARYKAADRREGGLAWQLLAAAVCGPTVIAVVAAAGRLRRTAIVFGAIALPLLLLALYAVTRPSRTPNDEPQYPTYCNERGPEAHCPAE